MISALEYCSSWLLSLLVIEFWSRSDEQPTSEFCDVSKKFPWRSEKVIHVAMHSLFSYVTAEQSWTSELENNVRDDKIAEYL